MVLEKNENLVLNICKVWIRSKDLTVDIPQLQKVYHTPSQITFISGNTNTPNGNLVNKTLRLSYPGLSSTDFQKMYQLARGVYQVYCELAKGDVFELASTMFPMSCDTTFDINRGHELVFSSRSPEEARFLYTSDSGNTTPGQEELFDYDFDFDLA